MGVCRHGSMQSADCCHICNADFGMRHYLIDVFDKIIIYPQPYFSTITQEYHKGEFNRNETLVFSWKIFKKVLVMKMTT
jgi:hypothetical protein